MRFLLLASALLAWFFSLAIPGSPQPASGGSLKGFRLMRILELKGTTFHVQGIDFDTTRMWVTSVDGLNRKGYLHVFSLATGRLIRTTAIQQGDRFHPGGISADAASLWIPLAEYRHNSTSVIQKRSKLTLDLEFQFDVPDHIGCIAVTPETLIGGNWDSREFYIWNHRGQLIRKVTSNTGNAYQDMKFDPPYLVASGLLPGGTGAIDWLEFPSLHIARRIEAGRTDHDVPFTREGMAIHADRLLLLPEDGPSRVFMFEADR